MGTTSPSLTGSSAASDADSDAPSRPSKRHERLLLAVVILGVSVLVVSVHRPALSARALFFDDIMYLSENELVQNPSSWPS